MSLLSGRHVFRSTRFLTGQDGVPKDANAFDFHLDNVTRLHKDFRISAVADA